MPDLSVAHACTLATLPWRAEAHFPFTGDIGYGMSGSYWRQLQAAPHLRGAQLGRLEMRNLVTKLYLLTQRDSGQTMAEYAVVLAVIAVGIFAALTFLSGSISGALDSVTNEI